MYTSSILKQAIAQTKSKSLPDDPDHTPGLENIIPALKANKFFDEFLPLPGRKIEADERNTGSFISRTLFRNPGDDPRSRNKFKHQSIPRSFARVRSTHFIFWGYPTAYFVFRFPGTYLRILEDGARNYIVRISKLETYQTKVHTPNIHRWRIWWCSERNQPSSFPNNSTRGLKHKGTRLNRKKCRWTTLSWWQRENPGMFMKGETVNHNDKRKSSLNRSPRIISWRSNIRFRFVCGADRWASLQITVYIKPHPRRTYHVSVSAETSLKYPVFRSRCSTWCKTSGSTKV